MAITFPHFSRGAKKQKCGAQWMDAALAVADGPVFGTVGRGRTRS